MLLRTGSRRVALLAGVILALTPQAGRAAAKPNNVKFQTFDEVDIRGTFYPSDAGAAAPCVLFLHETGSNRSKGGWDELAKKLQPDYAVLSFDFRGHGDSTEVGPNFWAERSGYNRMLKGARADKTTISFKDFYPSYYPMLVNDIAAAKLFLDRESNANRCNSANLLIIGAGDGATLGALWVTSEWQRRPLAFNPLVPGVPMPQAGAPPEGKDIAGAVWISMSRTVPAGQGGRTMPIVNWFTLASPEVRNSVPMYFIYGAKDTGSQAFATTVLKELSRTMGGPKGVKNNVAKLTNKAGIPGTDLKGSNLIGKAGLDTDERILKYLNFVKDQRGENAPERRTIPKVPERVPIERFLPR